MDEKLALVIVSGLGGWLVAQFTAVLKDYVYRRYLKWAVIDEIKQLNEELDRVWLNYARSLQIHTIGGIENVVPLPLSNFIFTNHYAEAALAFTRVQRTAMQLIHAHVESLNRHADDLLEFQRKITSSDRPSPQEFVSYGGRLRAILHNVAIARWHIRYYLEHPMFPVLEYRESVHADYAKYVDRVEEEIDSIVKSVKGLTRADFEKAYDPKMFAACPKT